MRRICKYCGKEYDGDPGGSCCPDCAAARRVTSVRQRICTICGISFPGGPSARFCPNCRADRERERSRRYKRFGPARHRGDTDLCVRCGKPYTINSGAQRYCPDCAPVAYRELDRAQSRRWQDANTTPAKRRVIRQTASAEIACVICGKMYVPNTRSETCSPECLAEYKRRAAAAYEKTHRQERNEYRRTKTQEKLEAMTPEERAAYREKINTRARENYRKRMGREKGN